MTWARLAVAASCAALLSASAHAAGGGHSGGGDGPSNRIVASFSLPSDLEGDPALDEQDAVAGPRVVDIPPSTVPAFNEDEELLGYYFITVRLVVAEGVDAWKVREKAHIIRDALIRAGHRRAVATTASKSEIDLERARAVLREGLAEVIPLDQIERLEITTIDVPAR